MKVTSVAPGTPSMSPPAPTSNNTESRSRAIAAAMGQNQPTQEIVGNQTQVSPEELGAIKQQVSPEIDTTVTNEVNEEPQAPEVTEEKTKEDPLSNQYAILARREKALRAKVQQQEQAYKAREAQLAEREAKLTKQPQFDASKYVSIEQFKADPLRVMADTGLSYDELTQQLLNQSPRDPRTEATISRLEAKIKAMEDAIDNSQKSYSENQQQAYQAAVRQIQTDVTQLVKSDPTFETIKATNSVKDVVQLIEETYKKDGVLMTVEEAAQEVEDYLVDQLTKYANIGKIKQRVSANASKSQSQAPVKTQAATAPKQPQPMKTLTNATSSQRTLSAKERAILAFKGELK